MIRKHRHASPILVLSLAALVAGGCATDTGLNALERAIGNLDVEPEWPDKVRRRVELARERLDGYRRSASSVITAS